jgi:antitoxin PrlF
LSYRSKMTSKGQVTIPKDLRDRFGLKEGEEVLMVPENEGILLKHRMDSMRSLRGLLREEVDLKKASAFIGKVRREWHVG